MITIFTKKFGFREQFGVKPDLEPENDIIFDISKIKTSQDSHRVFMY